MKTFKLILTRSNDALDELVSSDTTVTVLVLAIEKLHDARLVCLHPLKILETPHVEVKRSETFHLTSGRDRHPDYADTNNR